MHVAMRNLYHFPVDRSLSHLYNLQMPRRATLLTKENYNHQQLAALRNQVGESIRKIAQKTDVPHSVIWRAEAGEGVSYPVLCQLAAFYKVPVVSLLHPAPVLR